MLSHECLARDFATLMRCYKLDVRLGARLVNGARSHVLSAANLTAETRALLGRTHREDFEVLGYESSNHSRPPRIRSTLDACLAMPSTRGNNILAWFGFQARPRAWLSAGGLKRAGGD